MAFISGFWLNQSKDCGKVRMAGGGEVLIAQVCRHKPSPGKAETGRATGLAGQPISELHAGQPISDLHVSERPCLKK